MLATVTKSASQLSNSLTSCVAEIANSPKEKPDKLSFFALIDSTSFAISRDELKPALTGVLLQIKED